MKTNLHKHQGQRTGTASPSFTMPTSTSLGDLLAKVLPPAKPLIAPWLHTGESCLLWAGTGAGKSMIAQTVALAAAGGGAVLGWTFPNPSKVLYVDGEQSERSIQGRFRLLASSIAGLDTAKAGRNLTVMARATQEAATGFLDVGNEEQREAILKAVEKGGHELVIFDNLSTLTDTIKDENSAAEFKPVQALLTALKKRNVAVILVHHAGKALTKFRGSSSISTTFERVLGIVKKEGVPASRIEVTITLEKFRDEIPDGFRPTFPLTFTTEEDKSGSKVAVWTVGDLGNLEDAWAMFSAGAYRSKGEFVAAYNKRFNEAKVAGNFPRDFKIPWVNKLSKSPDEIRRAEARMKYLNKEEAEEPGDGIPGSSGDF